jgi:hypothetical protein
LDRVVLWRLWLWRLRLFRLPWLWDRSALDGRPPLSSRWLRFLRRLDDRHSWKALARHSALAPRLAFAAGETAFKRTHLNDVSVLVAKQAGPGLALARPGRRIDADHFAGIGIEDNAPTILVVEYVDLLRMARGRDSGQEEPGRKRQAEVLGRNRSVPHPR